MESAWEIAVPSSCDIRCGVIVHTCGNLSAVFRNGQLWIVTLTPPSVSVCSARVPARPIQATTRLSFWSKSRPSMSCSMTDAWLADGVGGHAEVGRDRFGAGVAFAPEEFQDLHASRTDGDHRAFIRSLCDPILAPRVFITGAS